MRLLAACITTAIIAFPATAETVWLKCNGSEFPNASMIVKVDSDAGEFLLWMPHIEEADSIDCGPVLPSCTFSQTEFSYLRLNESITISRYSGAMTATFEDEETKEKVEMELACAPTSERPPNRKF